MSKCRFHIKPILCKKNTSFAQINQSLQNSKANYHIHYNTKPGTDAQSVIQLNQFVQMIIFTREKSLVNFLIIYSIIILK